MPIPPPISQATLKAFLSGSQILGNLDPAELMGLHPLGDREHADQKRDVGELCQGAAGSRPTAGRPGRWGGGTTL